MDQPSNQAEDISTVPHFDVDDAFSDGEDEHEGFKFNPDTIREEFAKQLSWQNEEEDNVNFNENGFIETQRLPESVASISTIDINDSGSVHAASSQSHSQPQTPEQSSEYMSS